MAVGQSSLNNISVCSVEFKQVELTMFMKFHIRTQLSRLKTRLKYGILSLKDQISLKRKQKYISRKRMFILSAGIILGLFFVWFSLLRGGQASAWYSDNWKYRKNIQITSTHGSAQSNVYVTISSFDTSDTTKFQGDCGDLFFTKPNGEELPYYVVSGCGTASTTLHVQYDSLPNGSSYMYLYYGNPNAVNFGENEDFTTQASNYTIGTIGSEEMGKGPAAYWKFDEGNGTQVNDSTENGGIGNLGTGSSAPSWKTEEYCVSGKCLQFDGAGDYVLHADNAVLDIEGELTIALWIKPTELQNNTYYTVVYKGNPTDEANYYFQVYGDELNFGNYEFGWKGTSTTNTDLQINEWVHIAITYSDASDDIDFYVNGLLQQDNGFDHDLSLSVSDEPLYVGSSAGELEFYKGFMDEVKIYPYVRSADEIKQDYLFSSSRGSAVVLGAQDQTFLSDGLVAYWKIDEHSGTAELSDSSGNEKSLAMNGFVEGNWVGGKYGSGLDFDGSTTYLSRTDTFGLTNQLTYSAWVKTTDTTDTNIMGANDSGLVGFRFLNFSSGAIFQVVANGDSTTVNSNITIRDGEWHHLVGTYDGIEQKIYIDGVLRNSSGKTGNIQNINTYAIGGLGETAQFLGSIDEVRIYTRALSAAEVESLYRWSPGPVAHYDFNEGSGSSLNDQSGNGNSSTDFGADSDWTIGKYGNALSFDGDDYIRVDDNTSLDFGSGNFAVSAWVKSTAANVSILMKRDDGSECSYCGWFMRIDSSGYLQGLVRQQGGAAQANFSGTTTINDGNWHYVSLVKEASNSHKLYVDGQLTGTNTTTVGSIDNDYPLNFGWSWEAGELIGLIDDVRLYNYARTQEQILQDMNAGHPTVGTPIGSTVLHLSMDEGYGDTVHDKSPQANNGTLGVGLSAPIWTNDGQFGKALDFDGSDDYLSISDISFSATESWTASLWLREDDGESGWSFFLGRTGTTGESILYSNSTNQLQFRANDTTYVGGPTVTRNQWNHAVVSYDNGTIYIYLNGKQYGPYTQSSSMIFNGIGFAYTNDHYFKGNIDEVKIYPFALTSEEVLQEYNGGKGMVFGAQSTGVGGTTPSNSSSREYCVPGDSTTCNAPVLELLFEQGTGQYAYDTSTTESNGRLGSTTDPESSDPTWGLGPDHMAGSALSFDGSDDLVSVGNPSNLQITGDITYSAWIKPNQTGVADKILAKWQDAATTSYAYLLQTNVSNTFSCYSNDGLTPRSVTSTTTATANNWYFVSCVRSNQDLIIYVNGVKESTQNYAGSTWVNAAAPFKIGAGGNDTNAENAFTGSIDQVRVYNYARTSAQVAWDYSKGAPVAHYRLDECQGATVYNTAFSPTANPGNSGTINAASLGNTSIGTCTSGNNTEMWSNGLNGQHNESLDFDGSDDRIILPDIPYGQETTISFWFNSTDNSGTGYQYMYSQAGFQIANSINIYFNEDDNTVNTPGAILVSVMDSDDLPPLLADDIQTQVGLSDSSWHNLVVVINSSGTKAYIDGVQQISYSNGNGGINPSGSIYIGGRYDLNSARFYDGKIDDIRIYNYAMTPSQINVLYNDGAVTFK